MKQLYSLKLSLILCCTVYFSVYFSVFCSVCSAQSLKSEVKALPKNSFNSSFKSSLKNGGAIITNQSGEVLFEHRADDRFIPASTIKIATVAAAITLLGRDQRFKTEFYLLPGNILGVKGYGDPSMVSEEMILVAQSLSKKIKSLNGMVLDDSYFDKAVQIDGASNSNNPYDAIPGALAVNFNTINVVKQRSGKVVSAEKQTPITSIAEKLGSKLGLGSQRINLGKDRSLRLRYYAELLGEFLKSKGVRASSNIEIREFKSKNLIYTHLSKKNVYDISKDLLKYSTNFLANQLFLQIGVRQYGAPGTIDKSKKALNDFIKSRLNWKNTIFEGSGLSRKTNVSPREMSKLLDYFYLHKDLLPEVSSSIFAKTGTLSSVNTLAGYMHSRKGETFNFVIMINSSVPSNHRLNLAKKMLKNIW